MESHMEEGHMEEGHMEEGHMEEDHTEEGHTEEDHHMLEVDMDHVSEIIPPNTMQNVQLHKHY